MKKFILWLASVFNVNLVDGAFFEVIGDDVIIKGNLKVTGGITYYCVGKINS